jgi:hypothetical protein
MFINTNVLHTVTLQALRKDVHITGYTEYTNRFPSLKYIFKELHTKHYLVTY